MASRTKSWSAVWIAALLAVVTSPGAAELRPRALLGTRAEAATLIVQGIEGGSIRFAAVALTEAARWVEDETGSPRLRLPIAFEIPSAVLAAAGGDLEIYAYALTPRGGVAGHTGLALPSAQVGDGSGARLVAALDLEPATYSLRLLVLDPESHRFGLRRRSLQLADPEGAGGLGPPRLEDSCSGWTTASTAPGVPTNAAALPVLIRGSRVELSSALSAGVPDGDIRVRLEPRSAEDSEPYTLIAEPTGPRQAEADDALELAFELPPIGRGVYDLGIEIVHGAGDLTSPTVEVWVVDAADLGEPASDPCSRTWTAVVARAAATPGSPSPTAPTPETGQSSAARIDRRELKDAYRAVLDRLARTSDVSASTLELCRFEERFSSKLASLPVLLRLELEVVRRLAVREPDALPPLMLLHHQAYLEHRRQELYPLAGHSSRAVRAIGELLVDRRDQPESKRLASRILTSLAEYGHRNRSFIPSQLLLQDALAVAPDNTEALKLLAVNYEWFGRYDEAADLLERLVDLDANDREARLRLGVLRQRTGDAAAAERHLRRILSEGAEPWILSLAYQALGNLLTDGEHFSEATALLQQGRARLPGDQRLYLLNAHALERSGRVAEARRLLDDLPVDGAIGSPRFRYGESLTAPLASLRNDINREAAVRMPLLGRAMGTRPIGSGSR